MQSFSLHLQNIDKLIFLCFVEYQSALKSWLHTHWKSYYTTAIRSLKTTLNKEIVNTLSIIRTITKMPTSFLYFTTMGIFILPLWSGAMSLPWTLIKIHPEGQTWDSFVIESGHYPWHWKRLVSLLRGDTRKEEHKGTETGKHLRETRIREGRAGMAIHIRLAQRTPQWRVTVWCW